MKLRTAAILSSVSAAAIVGIAGWESYRARAYDDGVGVQTIGWGTTRREDGSPVQRGDTTTPDRALIALNREAQRTAREIAACIGTVPLAQHEFDAYVSLAYNIGPAAFCRSTIVKRLRQTPPDYEGACAAVKMWNQAGGRVLPGLVKRREAEYRLCMWGAQ
ncbi:MAG: hypothetical protein Fur0019_17260 [Tibeticola sp.]